MARRSGFTVPRWEETEEEALPINGLAAALLKWAGERSFRAGQQYFREGAVREWEQDGRTLTGLVVGSETYEVELLLRIDGKDVDEYECDCPYCEDQGAFCKHCVALGLAFATSAPVASTTTGTKPVSTKDALRAYLDNLEKPALVALLLRLADEDRELRQKLNLEAASAGPREAHAAALRKALENSLYIREFLDYHEVRDWARNVEGILSQVRSRLPSDPAMVMDLCTFGIERIEQAMNKADDSNGYIGDLLSEVQSLHLEACQATRPDPIALAHQLWDWERKSSLIYGTMRTYADVLGSAGRAEYRRLLEEEWEKLPPVPPGTRDYTSSRSRVSHALETLAEAEGDLDAVIAIRSKDLSHAYNFLRIAQALQEAGRSDEALHWAERGWQTFSDPDHRLAEFLVACYQQRKRYNDAVGIAWKVFESRPMAMTADFVKETAKPTDRWPELRTSIIELLRPNANQKPGVRFWTAPRADELVKFLIDEQEVEAAWAEAQIHSCSDTLWLKLAELRVKTHLQESIAVWKRVTENRIDAASSKYDEEVTLLGTLGRYLPEDEFTDYITALRVRFKRKRNFIKELDHRGY
jgi:tetratricopeptide (TPR) repeat protein